MSAACPWSWRLSLTEAGLARGSFRLYEIPVPTVAPYNDASVESPRSDGEQALHGHATVDFLWSELTANQAFYIRKFIDGAKDGTGWLYMTVDLNDDSTPGVQWADVRGRPHRDLKQADAGPIIGRGRSGQNHHENYRMLLNGVKVLNNPSLFTTSG